MLKQAFFFNIFAKLNGEKTQFLLYLKKLKAIFGPKHKVGAAFV